MVTIGLYILTDLCLKHMLLNVDLSHAVLTTLGKVADIVESGRL